MPNDAKEYKSEQTIIIAPMMSEGMGHKDSKKEKKTML